uniref:Uncharacterized protein n=1 Tax=viral metagenome TaxID=1070528 RepID=A0A6C0AFJ8_9ZZZZ
MFTVSNLKNAGPGSLRQAIIDLNLSVSLNNSIVFSVSGTILIETSLPHIKKNVSLNGKTAPGYTSSPVIKIDFNKCDGIYFSGILYKSEILGISFFNSSGDLLSIINSNFLLIDNCVFEEAEHNGILIFKSQNITIGSNDSFNSNYVSNYISKNKNNGILLYKSNGVRFIANVITNNLKNGIHLYESSFNIIGGEQYTNSEGISNNPTGSENKVPPVFIILPLGNTISGNFKNGVLIDKDSEFNFLHANTIGTDRSGTYGIGNHLNGVLIQNSDNNSLTGCKIYNDPFVYYNVISGNGKNGLDIKNSRNTTVQGNFFGLGADNNSVIPNKMNGCVFSGNTSYVIFGGVIPLGNNSSGNLKNGLLITDRAKKTLSFNLFAGLYSFGNAAPNGENGVLINCNSSENSIRTCVLSGNLKNGIKISDNASFVKIDPCIIGLNTRGIEIMPNNENGLLICGKAKDIYLNSDNASVIPRTTISGNLESGIKIEDCVEKVFINKCIIGLDVSMQNKMSNGKFGVNLKDNIKKIIIRKTNISGNIENGIIINREVENVKLEKNIIGENIFKEPIPNKLPQILDLRN